MRSALVICLIAGCGFDAAPIDDPGNGSGGGGTGGGSGSGSGSGSAGDAACDVQDASLKLCLTFDDQPMVRDLLVPPHIPIVNVGLTQILGLTPLARFTSSSHLLFARQGDFDVRDLTIDMWIDPDHGAQKHRYSLIDNHLQYAFSYEQDQRIQCTIGGDAVKSALSVGAGLHHVACRFDATRNDLRVYVDGDVAGCTQAADEIPTSGGAGLAIGASYDGARYENNYVGTLDSLHFYASAIAEAKICTAAGRSACSSRCPDGGRDGADGGRG